ncbi:MAG: hypothetical protein HKO67_08125 [Flavobacteriaceae bacterium]|nr:hypothetical protein [Flavobacteriaceae bacterium]
MKNLSKTTSYRILAVVFIIAAAGLVLLPKIQKYQGIDPEKLLSHAISPERYISTDELAEMIIGQDPSFLLIDVRSGMDYEKYALPGAINIPLDSLLSENFEAYLNQEEYDVVLYSNDDFKANQAWLLCNRMDYKNHKVLRGGVNQWFNTIINPKEPAESMPASTFEQYDFRKAASMYFGVAYPGKVMETEVPVTPKKVIPVKKKKKMPVEGGC